MTAFIRSLGLVVAGLIHITNPARAGVMISGDVTAGTGVFTISSDLVFSLTSDYRGGVLLAFRDWASSLEGGNGLDETTMASVAQGIPLAVNGVTQTTGNTLFFDGGGEVGDLRLQDAYLSLSPNLVFESADEVRLGPVDISLPSMPTWRSEVSGVFSGELLLLAYGGQRLSDLVAAGESAPPSTAVPLPATLVLLGVGLLSLVSRRRSVATSEDGGMTAPACSLT
jgi:hypothetical protein